MYQFFVIFVTFLRLQHYSVVQCRPIMPMTEPAIQQPQSTLHNAINAQRCNDRQSTDNPSGDESSGCGGVEVTTQCPPLRTGLFRNPLEVLGALFPPSKTINVCEMLITLQADYATNVRFSERGQKVCSDVCRQYQKNMVTNGPVEVILLPGYCDYLPDSGDAIQMTDLSTTCVCMYKVRCDSKTTMVLYKFQANCEGYLKVTMSQPDKCQPIT